MSLNTFGAVLSHAIQLEADLAAYYQKIGQSERAKASWNGFDVSMYWKSRLNPLKACKKPIMR
jgi:hypothetical protein